MKQKEFADVMEVAGLLKIASQGEEYLEATLNAKDMSIVDLVHSASNTIDTLTTALRYVRQISSLDQAPRDWLLEEIEGFTEA